MALLVLIMMSFLTTGQKQYACMDRQITIPAGSRLPSDAGNGNVFYHKIRRSIYTRTPQGWRKGFFSWRTLKNGKPISETKHVFIGPEDKLTTVYYLIPRKEYTVSLGPCKGE